jgi:prepilin peptidase CpaA
MPLVVMLMLAAVIDLRERRIPNWLNLLMLASGLLNAVVWGNPVSIHLAMLGVLTGFALTFLQFSMGAIGGGDVKMLAAIGAWVGPWATFELFLVAAMVGLVIVISQAIYTGRLQKLISNSMVLVANFASYQHVGRDHIEQTGQSMRSVDKPLPYAVSVSIAMVICLAVRW